MALRLIDNPSERLRREFHYELSKRDAQIDELSKEISALTAKIHKLENLLDERQLS